LPLAASDAWMSDRCGGGDHPDTARLSMDRGFPPDWMWSEAFALLARAERLHREVFRPVGSAARAPAWEPPVDILETDREVLVVVALPGVEAEEIEAAIVDGDLAIAGTRVLPRELQSAVIHRLELPQGRFERRVRLPGGTYRQPRRAVVNGCLLVRLEKTEASRV
jgi:HSP20 family protein